MDLTFHAAEGCYNARVAAPLIRNDRLLVMRDAPDSHDYLPGGRVRLHEPMERALLRELREELQIDARILRPLWLDQCSFRLKPSGERVHEQCRRKILPLPSETRCPALRRVHHPWRCYSALGQ